MNTFRTSAAAIALLASANFVPAAAEELPASGADVWQGAAQAEAGRGPAVAAAPHYEWQYHYVGRHSRYQGHWVLVR